MISATDVRSAIALVPSWQIDPAVDREELVGTIVGMLAHGMTPAQAAHDCRIGLQSLGRYRSRHLSACVHVLTALSVMHWAIDHQNAGCTTLRELWDRVRQVGMIEDIDEEMVSDALETLFEHAQPGDLTVLQVREIADLVWGWAHDSQP